VAEVWTTRGRREREAELNKINIIVARFAYGWKGVGGGGDNT